MIRLAEALTHVLPDVLRHLAEDKLAALAVQVFVAWWTGGN